MAFLSMSTVQGSWLSPAGEACLLGPKALGPAVTSALRALWGRYWGPEGALTNPSVPARALKSPEPLVGAGMAQGTAPVILLEPHGQEMRERGRDRHRRTERDAFGWPKAL